MNNVLFLYNNVCVFVFCVSMNAWIFNIKKSFGSKLNVVGALGRSIFECFPIEKHRKNLGNDFSMIFVTLL